MNLVPSLLNQRLANTIRYSAAAASFNIAGKAGFWRFVGIGLVGLGLGAAAGLGFFGYSFVARNSDAASILSSTFSKALSEVRLRTTAEGTVKIDPHEITLAKGQTISFDKNARVRMDPAATILANGELTVQAPTISAPQGPTKQTTTSPPVITNFTVFKKIAFGKGSVNTGWMFLTSVQKYPTEQYCYYTESSEQSGASAIVFIGKDQKPEPAVTATEGIDLAVAFKSCVWFKGENL